MNNYFRKSKSNKVLFGGPLKKCPKQKESGIPLPLFESAFIINKYGLETEGIFRISGESENIQFKKISYDRLRNVVWLESEVHEAAGLFKLYLRSLPEPLFTYEAFSFLMSLHEVSDTEQKIQRMQEFVESIPFINQQVIYFICSVFVRILSFSSVNKMKIGSLVTVIAPNLIWTKTPSESVLHSSDICFFFQEFLLNYEAIYKSLLERDAAEVKKAESSSNEEPYERSRTSSFLTAPEMSKPVFTDGWEKKVTSRLAQSTRISITGEGTFNTDVDENDEDDGEGLGSDQENEYSNEVNFEDADEDEGEPIWN